MEDKKRKILLVDDDPLIIRMYEYRLSRDGYEMVLAFDGEGAFAEAKKENPDIILLDLMMPKMNGVETLKMLKEDRATKKIPVMLLTNVGDDKAYVDLTKEIGAVDYLVKSQTSLKELAEKIAKVINNSQ